MTLLIPAGSEWGEDLEENFPQALVRLVPQGGARNARQIAAQWKYLSRSGEVDVCRSERHLGIPLHPDDFKTAAQRWAAETGSLDREKIRHDDQTLTTHIVVSFPAGTERRRAFGASRAWAEEMFGSGLNGGTFDYVTACHSDRPHPHMHLVVNRRALEGHWLKISRRHPGLNYERLRLVLVEIAERYGIALEATSRSARGLIEKPTTYAEYRRQARRAATA